MKLFSPAAERNKAPFAQVLKGILPDQGLVLEIAGGSGQHAAFMAAQFPKLDWLTADRTERELASMRAYRDEAELPNFLEPVQIDVFDEPWAVERADALVCMNMIHISPWEATLKLLDGASRVLAKGAPLCLYGPYRRRDQPTSPSNESFDLSLKSRDQTWGLRILEDVSAEAETRGFSLELIQPMPANNLTLAFRRI
jgi:SAM-dependent methyltransferase